MQKLAKRLSLLFCLVVAGSAGALAQQTGAGSDNIWSLEEAINHAMANNLRVQQSQLNRAVGEINVKQSRMNRLPSLNAGGNYNYNSGSFQDPVSFSLVTQNARTGNVQAGISVPLFMGFQQLNLIRQHTLDLEAAEQEALSIQNDISIQVVTAYLNILFADESIKNATQQRSLTQQQLDRTNILFKAGSVAENSVLDLQSQLATDELNFINAQNQLDVARLSLMQLLNLPVSQQFQIEVPPIPEPDQNPVLVNGNEVYDIAVQTLPAIRAVDLRVRSAARGTEVARGGFYPRLSLNAGISSRYSSTSRFLYGRDETDFGYLRQDFFSDEAGNQHLATVYLPRVVSIPLYSEYPFLDQLQDNIAKNVGLSLQVPIFNGFQVRNNVQRAMIAEQNAELNAAIARNNLRQTIEQAYVDAIASQRRYSAAKQQVVATEKNFRNAELRLNSGVINTVEFNIVANTFRSAQSNLLQAKYEYTFKLKILEFYQGKKLSL